MTWQKKTFYEIQLDNRKHLLVLSVSFHLLFLPNLYFSEVFMYKKFYLEKEFDCLSHSKCDYPIYLEHKYIHTLIHQT